jgi:hypothetical protein
VRTPAGQRAKIEVVFKLLFASVIDKKPSEFATLADRQIPLHLLH